MAVVTKKRPRATLVKQATIDQVFVFLQKLPQKTKEDLSLKEAIEQMQEPIKAVLAKGYSYADVAKMLADQGIKISALTLKNYVPSGRRSALKAQSAEKPPTNGRRKAKSAAS